MKTRLFLIVCAQLLLVLALAGPAAAQSKSNAPLRCHTDLSVAEGNPIGDWFGPITGAIIGDIAYVERDGGALSRFTGRTQHFTEDWTIYVGGYPSDVTISGYQVGAYNFVSTFRFQANGRVTAASPEFQWLVGHKTKAIGLTSALNEPGPVYITGYADIFIAGS
jgi:hypothetical protein